MINSVSIIGNGKVANYFTHAFRQMGLKVQQFARRPIDNQKSIDQLDSDSSICLICISDRDIAELSQSLPVQKGILAHSSGTVSLESLADKHPRRGIFYPLMSIAANSQVALKSIPFCLEASDARTLKALEAWSENLGLQHYRLSSAHRKQLHLAAVIGHNFSNFLYHWAYQELAKADLPLDILKPLISEQVKALSNEDPLLKQTGPAVRNDQNTIKAHIEMLENPELAALYKKLSELIQKGI